MAALRDADVGRAAPFVRRARLITAPRVSPSPVPALTCRVEDAFSLDETGELAWVRVELDLLTCVPHGPGDRARYDEFASRERKLLCLDDN